jgi:phenylalanyl-tRNA synthetase beta chain
LAELRLFDVYQGAPLGEREKSLAYTLVFRSPERSLTHDEVDECVERIVSRVSGKLGGRLR